MKTFLIAAGLMAAMLGAAPASAAPIAGNAPMMAAPAPQMRGDRRDERRWDRREDRRDDRRWDRRHDRRWGWNARRCHNVRRHHRWVRVCNRR